QTELREGRHPVVETDLRNDLPAFEPEHGGPGEAHPAAGGRRKRSDQEVAEGGTRVRSASLPAADDMVAFGDQVRGTPEVEIRKRGAEAGHEGLDVFATATRPMQRILQEHVGCRQVVYDVQVARLAPEFR